MKTKKNYILFLFLTLFSLNNLSAQEKKSFLQHRFDGFIVMIDKNYTKEKLTTLKNDFARAGIDFNFSKLVINKKSEIISISLKIKNIRSTATLTLNKRKRAIPFVKIGERDGIVSINPIINIPLENKKNRN
jgi:hypothetical protein